MNLTRIAGIVALVAICCTLSACGTVRYTNGGSIRTTKKYGPPPHAPAHGYRHKHGRVVLEYDSVLDVYAVSSRPNHYFHRGHYYRCTNSGWEITAHFDGPWKLVSTKKLPKGLRKTVHAKNKKHKKRK